MIRQVNEVEDRDFWSKLLCQNLCISDPYAKRDNRPYVPENGISNLNIKLREILMRNSPYAEPCTGVSARKVANAEWSALR